MGYRIRIKVCGVTTPEDAWYAGLLGADAVQSALRDAPLIDWEARRATTPAQ